MIVRRKRLTWSATDKYSRQSIKEKGNNIVACNGHDITANERSVVVVLEGMSTVLVGVYPCGNLEAFKPEPVR